MKAVELREMTLDELRSRERDLLEDLARQRIQLSIKRLDNPLQVRVTRRELARVKTIINEKLGVDGDEIPAARPAQDSEA
ncbi:MAG: 50S ribosomal protein L29 [Candidatus Krumholzibacteriota bacterium]|nr:50S ribosomal protein L29 [Candidatus Krumholzibacteriota bacterium]